jgi:double-stranded uracil-DNA glycosylase
MRVAATAGQLNAQSDNRTGEAANDMPVRRNKTAQLRGFLPIAAADARVLVLGSMPSVISLAKRQYYGHPQNAFWPIMGRLFGAGPELPYVERMAVLISRRVAVWDVLRSCHRTGSLDSAIRRETEQANDFAEFFRRHRQIGVVFFNGQKAETAFRRHVLAGLTARERAFHYQRLPSTSPAHAGRTLEDKLAAWQAVKLMIDDG